MKLKLYNYISAVCFGISSAALLFIPAIEFEKEFPPSAYLLAGTFWGGLFAGVILQIFLRIRTRRNETNKRFRVINYILFGVLVLSMISFIIVLTYFRTNLVALPVNLFVMLLSVESLGVMRRMEKLL